MKPLHYKTHTLAKRGLSLLCVLALCLSLLPVTALAAEGAPSSLYVGNRQVSSGNDITYWSTNNSGELTWVENATDNSNDWNVKYDPNTATLTLSGATIQGGTNIGSAPFGSGIYALSSNGQPVALTIELIGENTITGTFGIYLNATPPTTPGTDASLVIKNSGDNGDNGSLTVTGTSSYGLYIASGTGNASLTIKNVSVVANATSSYGGSGVCVQSGASSKDSPELSLAVNGGSLTASGTGSNDGILFYVGQSQATGATTSLTVSENAIVDARNGGISALKISETLPTPTPTGDNRSGIVFDGSTGTVYGTVALQKDLEIGDGETLTIPSGSSLNANGKLTNDGTINVEDGGSVTGSLSGDSTEITTPNITKQPSDKTVTEGSTAEFSVTASAGEGEQLTYQWQQKATDTGSEWEDISNATTTSYTTAATTTNMSGYQYRCVVTSASGVSVTSAAATLTVEAYTPPTTYTISADVTPVGAGTVTVNGSTSPVSVEANSTVNLVAAANEGYRFVEWQEDGTQVSTNVSYSFSADGNRTLTARFEKVYNVTVNSTAGGTATADKTTAGVGETVSLTATPNNGYRFTGWTFSDNVIGADVSSKTTSFTMPAGDVTATANFAKIPSVTPSTPPTVSEETTDAIKAADPGETVTVDLSSGSTTLDKEVFEALAGKDVTLVIDLGDGVSWTVNGSDIPENADFTNIDMGVTMNSDGIPVEVINAITGERDSVQITLAYDGVFGFTMTLTAPLGAENAGYWANLYHFDEDANAMTFETAAPIGSDGSVSLALSHASQYAIVIDDHNHGIVTLPFTDVSADDWFYDPVCYVYSQGLMTGTSATTFEPNTHLSRAMLVAVLHRLEGSPQASAGDFTDVADGDWYAQAVNWAASVGVVNGFDDGTFQPNAAITREQMAAILRNYAAYKGLDVTASGSLANYSDANSVSDWAKESVVWAVDQGLISGMTVDNLQPQGLSTRAQVAAVLERYLAN